MSFATRIRQGLRKVPYGKIGAVMLGAGLIALGTFIIIGTLGAGSNFGFAAIAGGTSVLSGLIADSINEKKHPVANRFFTMIAIGAAALSLFCLTWGLGGLAGALSHASASGVGVTLASIGCAIGSVFTATATFVTGIATVIAAGNFMAASARAVGNFFRAVGNFFKKAFTPSRPNLAHNLEYSSGNTAAPSYASIAAQQKGALAYQRMTAAPAPAYSSSTQPPAYQSMVSQEGLISASVAHEMAEEARWDGFRQGLSQGLQFSHELSAQGLFRIGVQAVGRSGRSPSSAHSPEHRFSLYPTTPSQQRR